MSRLIESYLSEFDRHLDFDRRLAQRVRFEVESHLADILQHDANEADAVARFGDPRKLSNAFVEAALAKRVKNSVVVLAIFAAVAFALMRLRSLWFDLAAVQTPLNGYLTIFDRAGFLLGLVLLGLVWRNTLAPRSNIQHSIPAITYAMLFFAVSFIANIARVFLVAGVDNILWMTGGIEVVCFVILTWQIRLTLRHAEIVQRAT